MSCVSVRFDRGSGSVASSALGVHGRVGRPLAVRRARRTDQADRTRPLRLQPDGPSKGKKIDKDQLNSAIDAYYAMMNWDLETGHPNPGKLLELGLGWITESSLS